MKQNIALCAAFFSLALTGSMFATSNSLGIIDAEAQKAQTAPTPPAVYVMGDRGSYLGVDITEVNESRVGPLKLKEERGVEITMVDQDAPAGKAGLKEHDVILEFNGNRVEGEESLRRMLRETPAGRVVTLGISRDGQPMQIKVTLGDRQKLMGSKSNMRVWTVETPPMPLMPEINIPNFEIVTRSSRRIGAVVDSLTPQLGEFFGVKGGKGVLVRSVEKGSSAEAAGLKAGDVIVKVDDEQIMDRNDWNREMRRKSGKVAFGIVRDKREQSLTINMPASKGDDSSDVNRFDWQDDDFNFKFEGIDPEKVKVKIRKLRSDLEKLNLPKLAEERAALEQAFTLDHQLMAEKMAEAHATLLKNSDKIKSELENARVRVDLAQQLMAERGFADAQKKLEQSGEKMKLDMQKAMEKLEKAHEEFKAGRHRL